MEIIGFHFAPPELIRRKKDGNLENLSDTATRRVFKAVAGKDVMPEHANFTTNGDYLLSLTAEATHTATLIIKGEKAQIEMKRKDASSNKRRSHMFIDMKSIPLKKRRVALLVTSDKSSISGIGIVEPHADTFAVEWYLCRIRKYT